MMRRAQPLTLAALGLGVDHCGEDERMSGGEHGMAELADRSVTSEVREYAAGVGHDRSENSERAMCAHAE